MENMRICGKGCWLFGTKQRAIASAAYPTKKEA